MNKLISIVVLLFAFAGVPAFAQLPPTIHTVSISLRTINRRSLRRTIYG